MVNTRLVYVSEKEKCISPLQRGFRKGRSTLDNLVFLESQIMDAFVWRNHFVSLFFDIEKAYDRTWRDGILPNMYDFELRENLPIFIFNFLAVRYFHVRIGHSSSHKFMQDQGVPQGSVLSVTLFNIHMSNILHQLPPSVRGMLYVDDLQVSCQGSDMRLIDRQLQTTVNRLVKWCDQNGHTISSSKSSCVHFCRKRNLHPDPSIHIGNIQILVVTDRVSLLRVYQALILSRLDYGCVVYGSARASVLKRLDTIHHSALRICSGAFRTSPVTSLYVVYHQPPLELRRRQLSPNYFIRAMPVPYHPLKTFALAIGFNRLYEARLLNIKPFSERAKAILNDAHLNNINIQENNILLHFHPGTSKFLTIIKQALLMLFISNSFLFIAVVSSDEVEKAVLVSLAAVLPQHPAVPNQMDAGPEKPNGRIPHPHQKSSPLSAPGGLPDGLWTHILELTEYVVSSLSKPQVES
ncbi:putative RNA-directed DNA polymerase from transposon X-element [Trichonephila clavipes]|nr:putative RNA-directed DNA polymerase from transposon X-element [Trichonephila clavipes]